MTPATMAGSQIMLARGFQMLSRITVIALLALFIVACSGPQDVTPTPTSGPETIEEARARWAARSTPIYFSTPTPTPRSDRAYTPSTFGATNARSSNVNSMVITSIEANREVVDSAISRQGQQISLVLIVRSATNSTRARQLGKTSSGCTSP